MILQFSGTVIFISWFKLNQDNITEWFCINKERPELKCEGKCFMLKQVKEAEKEQSQQELIGSEQIQWVYLSAATVDTQKMISRNKPLIVFNPFFVEQTGYPADVFQPPCV